MLSGSLDDFTLPEVLRMLSTLKKSGTLRVTRRAGDGRIDFRKGDVVYAETELAKSHLGQKLVSSGMITDEQLRQGLDVQATTGDRLGRILRVSDVISEEDLRLAVRGQIEDAAFELMCWEAGEFEWEKGEPEASDVDVSLDVNHLISSVQGRVDRREEIRKVIASDGPVPRMAEKPPVGAAGISITGTQWRVLALVDGSRTIATIAERAGVDLEEAERIILELATGGLIEVSEGAAKRIEPQLPTPTPAVRPAPQPEPREAVVSGAAAQAPQEEVGAGVAEKGNPPDEWFEDPVVPSGGTSGSVAFPSEASEAPVKRSKIPAVDRSAAVRELAGLFNDPEEVARVPKGPSDEDEMGDRPPPPPPRGRLTRWGRRTTKS